MKCYVCGVEYAKVAKHISGAHPEELLKQEAIVLKHCDAGLSARKIAACDDVWLSATAITRIFRKHFTKEQLEEKRKQGISNTIGGLYDSGEFDFVKEINRERNKDPTIRQKNSDGVKLAYEEGRKTAWATTATDEELKSAHKKTSATMKTKAANGELSTLFLSGEDSIIWKKDRSTVSRLYRQNLDFGKNERLGLLEKFNYCCGQCGVDAETLRLERNLLGSNRLSLECDHITPIADGGVKDWQANGQVLCSRCHIVKSIQERFGESEDVKNRYNATPSMVLSKILGGKSNKDGVVDIGNHSFFIMPLTHGASENKWLAHEMREKGCAVFYGDEWYNNRDTVLSMVGHTLGRTSTKIPARKCKVIPLDFMKEGDFFNKNHISGYTKSLLSLGLVYGGEIVAAISFRKPFVKKHMGKIELARFAIRQDTGVAGGFSKLLKASTVELKQRGHTELLTYADLRFGTGSVYADNGFERLKDTPLDYFYTDGYRRFNRFKFRAQDGMSEREYASSKGVYKIYGCGSAVYVKGLT